MDKTEEQEWKQNGAKKPQTKQHNRPWTVAHTAPQADPPSQ